MAEGISIDLNVHDRGTAVVKKFGEALGSLFKKFGGEAASATGGLRGHLNGLTGGFNQSGMAAGNFGKSLSGSVLPLKTIAATIATIGFGKLVSDTVQTSQQMLGLGLAFKAAAGGAKEGAAEFQ